MSKHKRSHTGSFSPPIGGAGGGLPYFPLSVGSEESLGFWGGLLIANRGEIAVRVIRAAKKHGIRTVAVYAQDDINSLHVSLADEAVALPGETLAETYLNQDMLIRIALNSDVEAIHPGYGFLSENADFAQKVADAGLVFIGPTPENIRLMGEKNRALNYVRSLGIPVLKSFRGTTEEILMHVSEMDFPVMVKASGGGGGKGMIVCQLGDELLPALEKAGRQALSYFGNGELFVEKYLPRARHIEVQLVADHHGNVLHFYERECSVQRRFQKIIEEAPSPSVDEKLRTELTSAAIRIARSMNYRNAGTIEFLLAETGHFYFLEMNTRIQVEHPVTEMITNTDLVSLQLLVAAGKELPLKQEDIRISGHAMEVRLCAEDTENQFHPSAGKLSLWQTPLTGHLRVETFINGGDFISPNYDSLLAKLVVWGEDRVKAISKLQQVLLHTGICGIRTNLSFLSGLIESEVVQQNKIYTRYVDENLDLINSLIQKKKEQLNIHKLVIAYLIFHFQTKSNLGTQVWGQIGFWRMLSSFEVVVEGKKYTGNVKCVDNEQFFTIEEETYRVKKTEITESKVKLVINNQDELFYIVDEKLVTIVLNSGFSFGIRSNLFLGQAVVNRNKLHSEKVFQNLICADLFGRVLRLNIHEGDVVQSGQILLTFESMKTEIHVICPVDACVKKTHVKEGDAVVEKQLLVELTAPSDSPEGEKQAH
jgi:acetyl/propionyl-CoA carboxylase alpha subunit